MINVLIIEDDFVIATDIKSIVESLNNYKSFIASNMQDALNIVNNTCIDIIISDIKIKGVMDGIEVTKILQNLCRSQVIFLTSYNDEQTLQRASEIDFMGYLLKPFKEDDLITSIKLCTIKVPQEELVHALNESCSFSLKEQQVYKNGEAIDLTQKEKQLFLLLWHAKGNVIPFAYVDETLWYDSDVNDATRRQLFYRLRTKLPCLPLKTLKYQGFILES